MSATTAVTAADVKAAEGRRVLIRVESRDGFGNPFETTITGIVEHVFEWEGGLSFQCNEGDAGLMLGLDEVAAFEVLPEGKVVRYSEGTDEPYEVLILDYDEVTMTHRAIALDGPRTGERFLARAKDCRERALVPTHAVVDTRDGFTWTKDRMGRLLTAATAAALVEENARGLVTDVFGPRFIVVTIAR